MAFIARRIAAAFPVMGLVALVVFLLLRIGPGDPASIIAGDSATAEQLDRIREGLGLDRPLAMQFGVWLSQVVRGDFGTSIISGTPVLQMIGQRLGPSFLLAACTIVLAVVVAVPAGIVAASKRGSAADLGLVVGSVICSSIPVFVIGYLLIFIFAVELRWLPVQGYRGPGDGLAAFARHQILPVLALALPLIALIARVTRASMLETLHREFVRTARAKGLRESVVIVRHALRNAALPIVTVIGNSFALLVGGVVVTESVFNIPGVGRLIIDAVLARDFPVIQGVILLTSAMYVGLNLLIDCVYVLLDPRIRER